MTQSQLGKAIGMAQTWVSKLEDPDYGKMTVATLLRLAGAFDADLEIKFRPFSRTLDLLPTQGPEYFYVPTFEQEYGSGEANPETTGVR
jgi:transcriptional regulator with XRE-family HTH domain